VFLHARLIAETGGSHGVRDLGMLQSAIARPHASFDGVDLYPDLFSQAAALLDTLARNHPFVDGNQRTAIATAALFLRSNSHRLTASNQEVVSFMMAVAQREISLEAMTGWLRLHSI
jgi:death-on-curing protein